ncbi:MAG: SbcC/MukB-like Walker B domain-containing protein, partial [Eubacteriales bacterium]|nr:SbcC/MukB-like Walker B domain-containing protein [Eubacteriales bacterium]
GIRAAGRQLEQLLELERQSGICRERGQALLKAGQEKETWARTAQEAKAAAGERALELEKLQGAEAEAVTLRAKAGETERRLGELKDGLDGWQKAEQLVLSMEEEMKALSEKKNGHRLETEETKKLWDTVKDAELSLAELEKEELRLFSEKERQEQLSARVKNRTELLERLEKKQQEYRQAAEEYGCLRARYEQLEQLFFDGQAGILAGRLEEGKPCPVCGAVHHPAPAVPLEGAPEKDELDQEKRKVEKAAELAQKLSGDAGHLLEALEKEEQLLSQAGTELYQDGAPDHMERRLELEAEELSGRQEDCRRRQEQAKKDKQKKEELTERMEVLEQQQEKLEADEKALSGRLAAGRAAAEERKKRLEELAGDAEQAASVLAGLQQAGEKLQAELEANSLRRKEKAQLEGLLETDRSRQEEAERSMHQSELQMTALQTELSAAKAQEETLKGQLEKLLGQGETPGEAREALNSQITGWTKEKQRLEQEYKAAGEECRRLQMARAGAAQASETLKSQLKALEELKEEEILAALETLKAEKEQRAAVFRDRYAAEKKNREIYQSVSSRRTAMEEAEQEYAWIRGLSDTANGTLNGKQKIELETYVQMSYFDRILRRANLRFLTMSSGQYELKRREEVENRREKAGLELNVIDHYNGSERSVKTLSGGESFQASLSLALGLSDEIQARAGGIRLDAMFVDEGFGSLDEDALNQAMKALEGLTEGNRLVGIISHVAELKERIESKILVTRTRNGGGAGSRAEVAGRQTPEPFILF